MIPLIHEVPRVVKIMETESKMAIASGWGEGEGSYCLMGVELQFCKIKKKFCGWMVVIIAQYMSVLTTMNNILKSVHNGKYYVIYVLP